MRAHQLASREVLRRDLDERRVLELMETGLPIRAHMALLDESAADRLIDVFVASYRLEREGLIRSFPGMLELVDRLRSAGVPVAVVTSKLRADALTELTATGFLARVDAVIAFEDTRSHKPNAAPQIAALRAVDATTGIGVGDLPGDVASAREAGMDAVGVGWGYGDGPALLAAGAAAVCETSDELELELNRRLGLAT